MTDIAHQSQLAPADNKFHKGNGQDKKHYWLSPAIFGETADIRNLGDVRWHATEDNSQGKGTGRHIAMFILRGSAVSRPHR